MSKYEGTYSCGHEGMLQLYGKTSVREYIANKEFSGICPDCKKLEQEKTNQENAQKAIVMELPTLLGTPKQVSWAETLRIKALDELEKLLNQCIEEDEKIKTPEERNADVALIKWRSNFRGKEISFADGIMIFTQMMMQKEYASFWIDNRNWVFDRFGITRFIHENPKVLSDYLDTIDPVQVAIKPQDAANNHIIKPDQEKYSGCVEINYETNETKTLLLVTYEKNDAFRDIVKANFMTWSPDNRAWVRKLYSKNGTPEDRAAGLARDLLAAGFTVLVAQDEAYEKAIHPDTIYPEQRNWIIKDKDAEDKLLFVFDQDDAMYKKVRSLPGACWDRGRKLVAIKVTHAAEIRDFAALYNFQISEIADHLMAKWEVETLSAKTIKVEKREEQKNDPLKNILDTSSEVLSDLVDDDDA